MTPSQWARIRQIFESAIEQPPSLRASYLDAQCGSDHALRHEVESLLANHDTSSEFMNRPVADLAVMIGSGDESSITVPRIPQAGPYKLERCIARGGMGSVWLASRSDQAYERKVAVKVVKRGMDTVEILTQFRRERQLLAGMHHPNIAGLLDAGSTPEGTPYLVMEYVEGTPIDQYLARRQSSITERLQLFRQVCSAVHYAHQNLVVHRDLKPSNILVDSEGVPKLLDFGIAQLLGPKGAAEAQLQIKAMTLDYASPEQIRGDLVTTQSDVYSLGVLLFKLLTGKLPYAPVRSREQYERAICEAPPLKASAVVAADEAGVVPQATQAIGFGVETRQNARKRLHRKLKGDLDAILEKALSKEPLHRYLSAEQFSADIRRYLEGRPVRARGDRASYRFGKFVHRNAAALALTTLIAAAIIVLGISATLVARNTQSQLRASQAREAQLRADEVRTLILLGETDQRNGNPRASEDFSKALAIATQDREIAEAARGAGIEQFRRGDRVGALVKFTQSLNASESWLAREPSSREARTAVAAANDWMGQALAANGEAGAAIPKLRKALDLYRDLTGSSGVKPSDETPESLEAAIVEMLKR